MAAPEIHRPTFDLEAALSADLTSNALRKGDDEKYFTFSELHAIEQGATRALAHCPDAAGRKFMRHCVALCRSHRNLLAAMVDADDNDTTVDPF